MSPQITETWVILSLKYFPYLSKNLFRSEKSPFFRDETRLMDNRGRPKFLKAFLTVFFTYDPFSPFCLTLVLHFYMFLLWNFNMLKWIFYKIVKNYFQTVL